MGANWWSRAGRMVAYWSNSINNEGYKNDSHKETKVGEEKELPKKVVSNSTAYHSDYDAVDDKNSLPCMKISSGDDV